MNNKNLFSDYHHHFFQKACLVYSKSGNAYSWIIAEELNVHEFVTIVIKMFCVSPCSIEAGASTQMFCLLTDAALEHSGKYFVDNAVQTNEKRLHKLSSNKDVQQQVWDASMRFVKDFLAKQSKPEGTEVSNQEVE